MRSSVWFLLALVFGVLAIATYPRRQPQVWQPAPAAPPASSPISEPSPPAQPAVVPPPPEPSPDPVPTPEPAAPPPPPPPLQILKHTQSGGGILGESWQFTLRPTEDNSWVDTPLYVNRDVQVYIASNGPFDISWGEYNYSAICYMANQCDITVCPAAAAVTRMQGSCYPGRALQTFPPSPSTTMIKLRDTAGDILTFNVSFWVPNRY